MKPETKELIREATEGVKLRDIVLYESRLFRDSAFPEVEEFEALQQHKRGVRFAVRETDGAEGVTRELHVIVSLGERVVDNVNEKDPKVYFGIEADYHVIYDMIAEVSEEALKAFANFNSVHNVWPFWRQHVFDAVAKARLPAVQIPLFSGSRT